MGGEGHLLSPGSGSNIPSSVAGPRSRGPVPVRLPRTGPPCYSTSESLCRSTATDASMCTSYPRRGISSVQGLQLKMPTWEWEVEQL